jgi:FtsP/CotA-like multicopper oxidase with cupredoxin domain
VTQAGTFWYHPHFDTAHQVDHGLYGVLVVEDPAEPSVDRDLVLVLDDWGQLQEEEEEEEEDEHHGDSVEGWWTVNGVVDPAFPVTGGETLRLRLVNTSNHGYLDLSLVGARVLARDQGLLSRVETTAQEVLAPGDRVELEVRPGDADLALLDAPYSLNGGTALGDPEPRVHLTISDPTVPADPIEWPTQTEAPTLDPGRTDITWTFQGSIHGDNWMISGEQFPNVTIPQALLGDELIVEVRNLSATEHPFHLHGMHFEVLSINGEAPGSKTVEDTLNIPLYSAARLRVIADNPGDWMAHCHILPHAEGGMMTVLRVLEP